MANNDESERAVIKQVDMDDELKKIVIDTTLEYMDACFQD